MHVCQYADTGSGASQLDAVTEMFYHTRIKEDTQPDVPLGYHPDAGVVALVCIPEGMYLGELVGLPTYIWDITHTDYVYIDDERVLDLREPSRALPRSILSYLREENETSCPSNCVLEVVQDDAAYVPRVRVRAFRPIHLGEEIVYSILENIRHG